MNFTTFLWIILAVQLALGLRLLYKFMNSKKLRARRQRQDMRNNNLKDPSPVSDPAALKLAEEQVRNPKSQLEVFADRGYFVVRTFGSARGFSSEYMHELMEKIRQENLRVELIEVNGSLVALETGNFQRFQLLAHGEDAEAVEKFLSRWFAKS